MRNSKKVTRKYKRLPLKVDIDIFKILLLSKYKSLSEETLTKFKKEIEHHVYFEDNGIDVSIKIKPSEHFSIKEKNKRNIASNEELVFAIESFFGEYGIYKYCNNKNKNEEFFDYNQRLEEYLKKYIFKELTINNNCSLNEFLDYKNEQHIYDLKILYPIHKNSNQENTTEKDEEVLEDTQSIKLRKKRKIYLLISLFSILMLLFIYIGFYFIANHSDKNVNIELKKIHKEIVNLDYKRKHTKLSYEELFESIQKSKHLKEKRKNIENIRKWLQKIDVKVLKEETAKIYDQRGAKATIDFLTSNYVATTTYNLEAKEKSGLEITIAKLYLELHQVEKAKEKYKRAIEIFFDFENVFEYSIFLNKFVKSEESIILYKKLLKETLSNEEKIRTLTSIANSLKEQKKFDDALSYYFQALHLYPPSKEDEKADIYLDTKKNPKLANSLIVILSNIAIIYDHLGLKKEAMLHYKNTVDLHALMVNNNLKIRVNILAKILTLLAIIESDLHLNKESLKHFKEAIKLYKYAEKNNFTTNYFYEAKSYFYISEVESKLGLKALSSEHRKKSKKLYKESLKYFKTFSKINPLTISHEIFVIYEKLVILEDNQKISLKYEYEALDTYKKWLRNGYLNFKEDIIATLLRVAKLEDSLNMNDFSQKHYIEALHLIKSLQKSEPKIHEENIASILFNLGIGEKKLNKNQLSLKYLKKSLKIFQQLSKKEPKKFNETLVKVLINIANIKKKTNQNEYALKYFNESLNISKSSIRYKPDYFNKQVLILLNDLANLEVRLGLNKQALQHFHEALEFSSNMKKNDMGLIATIYWNLAILEEKLDKNKLAIKHYSEVLKIYKVLKTYKELEKEYLLINKNINLTKNKIKELKIIEKKRTQ